MLPSPSIFLQFQKVFFDIFLVLYKNNVIFSITIEQTIEETQRSKVGYFSHLSFL